jgi:hypothetical protein
MVAAEAGLNLTPGAERDLLPESETGGRFRVVRAT